MRIYEIQIKPKLRPNKSDIEKIRKFRHQIRCDEKAGGQCGWVAEFVHDNFGWTPVSGTYCNDVDEPVCCDHVWNILPDGAVFDPTADQLGSGHDMKIVPTNDPDFKHYRYQWDSENEFTPDHPTAPDEIRGKKWSGKDDWVWADEIRNERGEDWFVTNRDQYAHYVQQRNAYANGKAKLKAPFPPFKKKYNVRL